MPAVPSRPSGTAAGGVIAGRYRLRVRVGSDTSAGTEFWQAEDTVLQRDVAVSLLRRPDHGASTPRQETLLEDVDRAEAMVSRALRGGSFEHRGAARLLDVLAPGATGLPIDLHAAAVTEWIPGRSLAEVLADGLVRPMAAARAVAPLAAAAEAAHRHGLVLGCDHPQRVRLSSDGRAMVCFALARPDATPADDVRGLGAVLHALLTSRWALSDADAARAGLSAADRAADGAPVPPSQVRPGVPVELDTLVVGTLGTDAGPGQVHTAAAVHRLLSEAVADSDRVALFPPDHDGVPSAPGDVWQDDGRSVVVRDPGRGRKLAVGLAALGVAALLVLGYVGLQLSDTFFADGSGEPDIVVGASPTGGGSPGANEPNSAPSSSAGPAQPVAAADPSVFTESGGRDGADSVGNLLDDDPDTAWRTSTYRQQLPALKSGIGVRVTFPTAVQLAAVRIDSPSPGTVVEVRSASEPGAALDETTVLAEATLTDGATTVALPDSEPVTDVLLWITALGGGGTDHVSEIKDVTFLRAAG